MIVIYCVEIYIYTYIVYKLYKYIMYMIPNVWFAKLFISKSIFFLKRIVSMCRSVQYGSRVDTPIFLPNWSSRRSTSLIGEKGCPSFA